MVIIDWIVELQVKLKFNHSLRIVWQQRYWHNDEYASDVSASDYLVSGSAVRLTGIIFYNTLLVCILYASQFSYSDTATQYSSNCLYSPL